MKNSYCVLSIIVPVYNAEKYLRDCIESILSQTFSGFELILVDDGSTDSSGEICREYANKDNRVRVIHQENKDVSGARNSGLNIANGEIIGFVDSDDWIESDMYETLIKDMEKYQADVVICGFDEKFAINIDDKNLKKCDRKVFFLDSEEALKSMFLNKSENGVKWGGGYVMNRIYKRKSFVNFKFQEKIICNEDSVFSWDIFHESKKIVCHPCVKYHYRQVKTSKVHKDFDGKYINNVEASYYIYKKTEKYYPRLSSLALSAYFNNLILLADELILHDKLNEFYCVKEKMKKILKKKIFCNAISFNKKKQALFMLFPYSISKKIFYWRKKKNDWRKKKNKYFE